MSGLPAPILRGTHFYCDICGDTTCKRSGEFWAPLKTHDEHDPRRLEMEWIMDTPNYGVPYVDKKK